MTRVGEVWFWILGSSPRMTTERMWPTLTTEGADDDMGGDEMESRSHEFRHPRA